MASLTSDKRKWRTHCQTLTPQYPNHREIATRLLHGWKLRRMTWPENTASRCCSTPGILPIKRLIGFGWVRIDPPACISA